MEGMMKTRVDRCYWGCVFWGAGACHMLRLRNRLITIPRTAKESLLMKLYVK